MSYKKIGDYGMIGNGATIALVGRDGAIDWLCLPYLDSPSVFAALLDDETGGRFAIQPVAAWDSAQNYLPRTNILKTLFRTARGEAEILDFMPVDSELDRNPANAGRLIRRVTGLTGAVELRVECSARFDYARAPARWSAASPATKLLASADACLALFCSRTLDWKDERATFVIGAGETVWVVLDYVANTAVASDPSTSDLAELLDATHRYWIEWTRASEISKYPSTGFWRDELDRSALVLKLLQMKASGAVAAAATTSLPAPVHGERNWDYRFHWIRDASMTFSALLQLGHQQEVTDYLDWLGSLLSKDGSGRLDIVYRLREPEPPESETVLAHLSGYKDSRPVRIGQFVIHQRQHDIYGQLLDTLFAASHFIGKISLDAWRQYQPLVDQVCEIWREEDDGIWEARSGSKHYTHSKLMCWVALDRGIKIAEHYGFPADLVCWRTGRDAVRAEILEKGYHPARGSFTQHYDTDAVDAALLLIPLLGFLPIDDPRVAGTIRLIEQELLQDGVLLRYKTDDGLPGQEGGFMICLFWYLRCLILQRRYDLVEDYLRNVDRYANHLGLFGEQFDPRYREIIGNFPQAYSHIGYAMTVLNYLNARAVLPAPAPLSLLEKIGFLIKGKALNADGEPALAIADPAQEMRRVMNILRGQFYDGHALRVDYAAIKSSAYYAVFRRTVAALRDFDPAVLRTDADKIAFWINVYNTFVIHGVIELGIDASIKEVPLFFRRIRYCIGGLWYTPNDIEHGLLRGNVIPPHAWRKQFSRTDPRLPFVVEKPDARIHFALVCASRTCPPIEVFDADQLDMQLDTSARIFISGTTRFDATQNILWISEIFSWYRTDFGGDDPALAHYIARYLFDAELAQKITQQSGNLKISFTPYDWRLNR